MSKNKSIKCSNYYNKSNRFLKTSFYEYLYSIASFKRILQYNITKKPYPFPTMFQIQTNNICNASCIMCPNSSIKNKKPEVMSDELFEKIIKEIAEEKNQFIAVFLYLKNEPLTDKDIFNKYKKIKQLSNENILTGLITNGSLLDSKRVEELKESDLDQIRISLDAANEETYKKIRVGLDYKTVIKNIEKLEHSNCNTKIHMGFVRQKINFLEFKDFKKFCRKKGFVLDVHNIYNRIGDLTDFKKFILEKKDIPYFERVGDFVLKKIMRCCPHVLITFNILCNGNVILCCNDYNDRIILGNVKESSIKEIWNGKKFQEIRAALYKDYNKVSICKNCNFWYKSAYD